MVDSVASTANLSRIKDNVRALRDRGEPIERIRDYVAKEGVTPQAIRDFAPTTLEDVGRSALAGAKGGAEIAAGTVGEIETLPGRAAGGIASMLGADPATVKSINEFRAPINPVSGAAQIADKIPGVSNWMKKRTGDLSEKVTGTRFETTPTEMFAPTTQDAKRLADATPAAEVNYEPQTTPGRYTKTGVEGATGAALTGGRNVLASIVSGAAAGLGSEAGADVLGESPMSRTIGGIAGGLLPGGINRVTRPMGEPPPNVLRAGEKMKEAGVDLTAGQKTGSKRLQRAEVELGGATTDALVERQQEQFSKAAMAEAGMPAKLPTAENLRANRDRIGSDMDRLAASTTVPFDQQLQDGMLDAAILHTEVGANPKTMETVQGVMDHAADLAAQNGGVLSGEAYQNLTTRIRQLRDAEIDPAASEALGKMQEAINDAVERTMPQDTVERWRSARNQYRNQLILENAVAKGATSDQYDAKISPARLGTSTDTVEGTQRVATESNSPMTELATAGAKAMPKLPDSNTAARTNLRNPLMWIPEAAGAAAGKALMSDPVQGWLSAQGPQIPSKAKLAALMALRQNQNEEGGEARKQARRGMKPDGR